MKRPQKYLLLTILVLSGAGLLFAQGRPSRKKLNMDSLLRAAANTALHDTLRLNALHAISWKYVFSNPDSAFIFAEKLYRMAGKDKPRYQAQAANTRATAHAMKGNMLDAIEGYREAIKLYERAGNKAGVASGYGNLANIFGQQGDYSRSLEYSLKDLKLKETIGDSLAIASTYTRIGIIFYYQKNYDKALDYCLNALDIAERKKDKNIVSIALHNIADIYLVTKKYDQARIYIERTILLCKETNDKYGLALAHHNMGSLFSQTENYPEALASYKMSLLLDKETGNQRNLARNYVSIAAVLLKQKKFAEAKKYGLLGLNLSVETQGTESVRDAYLVLSELSAALGDARNAFYYYKLHVAYHDSLFNEKSSKEIEQRALQYQFDKQQAADSIKNAETMKQEALKHQQEIDQQKLYTYGGSAGFLLMLLVAGVSFRAYRQKQKANEIISEQKLLVEEKQKEILDSIHYAKRIQESLFPSARYIQKQLERLNG